MSDRGQRVTATSPGWYSVVVAGAIDPGWADHFDGMRIEPDNSGETRLVGFVSDQAALQGVLERLHGLSLPILRVTRLGDGSHPDEPDPPDRADSSAR